MGWVKFGQFFSFVFLILLLSGCANNDKSVINHYYLYLMGESQTWKLTGYEVVITPTSFKVGNGTLTMKNVNEYITDTFQFETHAIINDEDMVVHSGSVSGARIDIAKKATGAIESGTYLNKNGNPITLNDISDIYMILEWRDIDNTANVKERIDLYSKDSKDKTFLN